MEHTLPALSTLLHSTENPKFLKSGIYALFQARTEQEYSTRYLLSFMTHPPKSPKVFWIQALLLFIMGFVVSLWLLQQYAPRETGQGTMPPAATVSDTGNNASFNLPPLYKALDEPGLDGRQRYSKTTSKGSIVFLDLRRYTANGRGFEQFSQTLQEQFSQTTGSPRKDSWTMGAKTVDLIYIEGTQEDGSPMAIYAAYTTNTDLILIGTPESVAAERISFLGLLHDLL